MVGRRTVFVLVPLGAYAGLWLLGGVLFLAYFQIFGVPMNLGYNEMIQRIPALLAVPTVPLSSFVSLLAVARTILARAKPLGARGLVLLGAVSVLATFGLDLLVTVLGEEVNILAYPTDLMYLFAYVVIIPSVFLGGVLAQRKRNSPMQ